MPNTRRFSLLAAILVATLAQAGSKPYDPGREGYIVIGLAPGDFVVDFVKAKAKDKQWRFDSGTPLSSVTATDGYVVLRVPADETVAIKRIRETVGRHTRVWTWCRTGFTPIFSAPAGHVVYFADITYKWPEDMEPWFTTAADLDHARAYVDAHHPELAGKLEQGEFRTGRPTLDCDVNGGV